MVWTCNCGVECLGSDGYVGGVIDELEFLADVFPGAIFRINAIGALGFASARAKSPAVAEGGNGCWGVPVRFW
jgi:hypothetical protein